jgi:hypothetical protein
LGVVSRILPKLLPLLALALAPAALVAADLDSLLKNSPFGSAGTTATAATAKPLEFRGVFAEGGEYFFNIYLADSSRSEWLGLDATYGENLTVKTYDPEAQQLTVEYAGQTLTLTLVSAKRAAVAATTPRPAAVANQPDPSPAQASAAPTDAERMSKIAEEIRRRRELRQQALQKKSQ